MKVLKITIIFCVIIITNAQAQLIGIANQIISAGGTRDMKGEKLINFGTSLPISLKTATGNGSVVLPMTHVGFEYGIVSNITVGALIGYGITKTSDSYTSDLIGLNEDQLADLLCQIDPSTCPQNTTSTKTTVKIKSWFFGGNFNYHFGKSEKADWYIGATAGFKKVSQSANSNATDSEIDYLLSQLSGKTSNFFGTGIAGLRYYVKPNWAIRAEAGMGYGYGDDIAISQSTLILTLGGTYNFGKNTTKTTTTK
jgi:hypothetical protein